MCQTSVGSFRANPRSGLGRELSDLHGSCNRVLSTDELKGSGKLERIRPGIFDVEPDLGLKLGHTNPNIPIDHPAGDKEFGGGVIDS